MDRPGQHNGWDDPVVRHSAGRPADPTQITISAARRIHLLVGDADGIGGGHAPDAGVPGKTEFPAGWDDDTIIERVLDVARFPDQPPRRQPNGRWFTQGTRDGVSIVAIVRPDGEVHTAWPVAGPGVTRNPAR